jgi:hypothetical protein
MPPGGMGPGIGPVRTRRLFRGTHRKASFHRRFLWASFFFERSKKERTCSIDASSLLAADGILSRFDVRRHQKSSIEVSVQVRRPGRHAASFLS